MQNPVTGSAILAGSADLLTPEEAAAFLKTEARTLAVWRCTGRYQLRYVKIGRHVRYKRADLEAFIASRTRGGAPEGDQ
jgi:excisionase family DNA binding protein